MCFAAVVAVVVLRHWLPGCGFGGYGFRRGLPGVKTPLLGSRPGSGSVSFAGRGACFQAFADRLRNQAPGRDPQPSPRPGATFSVSGPAHLGTVTAPARESCKGPAGAISFDARAFCLPARISEAEVPTFTPASILSARVSQVRGSAPHSLANVFAGAPAAARIETGAQPN